MTTKGGLGITTALVSDTVFPGNGVCVAETEKLLFSLCVCISRFEYRLPFYAIFFQDLIYQMCERVCGQGSLA